MDIERDLIRVAEGEKLEGYSIIGEGLDSKGRYKDISTPTGEVKRVHLYSGENLEKLFFADYNTLHKFRREGDSIVLYYNRMTRDFYILAVKPGDDLGEPPWRLHDAIQVSEEMLLHPSVRGYKGIVTPSDEFLQELQSQGMLSSEEVLVLRLARKNVGFHL